MYREGSQEFEKRCTDARLEGRLDGCNDVGYCSEVGDDLLWVDQPGYCGNATRWAGKAEGRPRTAAVGGRPGYSEESLMRTARERARRQHFLGR